jgi:L-galactose dehydrogenase/L-glyceraldehyde 3-phosphate reductase
VRYRPLGATGIEVSELGFGCGNVGGLMTRGGPEEQRAAVARALDSGITYFDTAPSYGNGQSEISLGRALSALGAWDRVHVGTKVNLSTADLADPVAAVRASLQASLGRLGRGHVDLLQLHSRIGGQGERALSAADVSGAVAEAMRAVAKEGLVRHAGITGMGQTGEVLAVVRSSAFDTVQSYFNVLNPSSGFAGVTGGAQDLGGVIDSAKEAGMGVIAIRVMAAGAVSGSAERARLASPAGDGAMVQGGEFSADLERARSRALFAVTRDAGAESTLELSLRFVISKPGVSTALVGFSDIEQLEAAVRWVEKGDLDAATVDAVLSTAR